MKISDGIKLGIGFYVGKMLCDEIIIFLEKIYIPWIGKMQDKHCDEDEIDKYIKKNMYFGTEHSRKYTAKNKKNPIGFV